MDEGTPLTTVQPCSITSWPASATSRRRDRAATAGCRFPPSPTRSRRRRGPRGARARTSASTCGDCKAANTARHAALRGHEVLHRVAGRVPVAQLNPRAGLHRPGEERKSRRPEDQPRRRTATAAASVRSTGTVWSKPMQASVIETPCRSGTPGTRSCRPSSRWLSIMMPEDAPLAGGDLRAPLVGDVDLPLVALAAVAVRDVDHHLLRAGRPPAARAQLAATSASP